MPGPWEKYGGAPTAPVVSRVVGTPRPKPVAPRDPLDDEAQRLEIDLKRQRLAKGEPMGEGAAKLKSDESQAAFLSTNLFANANILANALKSDKSAASPTWGQLAAGLLGEDARNAITPDQRQVVYNAQRLITDSALTLGTGAAYTEEQISAYQRGFFPQVGDSPAAIEAKRQSLQAALVAAKLKAGNAAPQIDQAMAALGMSNAPLTVQSATAPVTDTPKGQRFTPEQETEWKTFLLTAPSPEAINAKLAEWNYGAAPNAGEVSDAARKGRVASGVDYTKVDEGAEAAARAEMARQDQFGADDGPRETLLKSGMGLGLTDEAAGVGRGLSKLVTGGNPVEGYRLGRDAERLRIADARKQLGYGGTALEVAGGFLSANPSGTIRAATGVRDLVMGGAKSGAGVGALAGFGMGEGFSDSAEKAAIGGAIGGVLGGGISGLSARYAPRGVNPEIAEAAGRQDVRLNAALVDPARRNRVAAYESSPETSAIVGDAFAQTENSLSDAALRLGSNGQAMPQELAGDVVQGAGRRFIDRSRGVAKRLYDRAASLAGDAQVDAAKARAMLDQEIATLQATPNTNSGEIDFLTGLREDLSKPMTIDAIRNLRTSIRGRIQEKGLTMTQAQSRAMGVLDAASDDIASSVPAGAAKAYKRADAFYRERQTQIETVVQKFIGRSGDPISGEAAFRRLKSMASPGGDGKKIATMMRMFEPSEQADVGATIAASLGRRAPDEPFSPALFVTQARALSPSARATIFGPSGKQAIDDLILLSRAQRDARGRLNNSGSGRVINYKALLSSIVLSGGVGATQGTTGAIVGAGAAAAIGGASGALSKISARALMSPNFAKWLASAPTGTPTAAQAHIQRLSNVAARDPAIAGEINQLQRLLTNEFRPAMASDEASGENKRD